MLFGSRERDSGRVARRLSWAATRHQLNTRTSAATSFRCSRCWHRRRRASEPSRARDIALAALNHGLTPIEVRNNNAVLARAVMTRTLVLISAAADDGTVDVATWRARL